MNSSLQFENYAAVRHQFHFVLETIETAWGLYIQYHYRITEDKYIQIAVSVEDDAPEIRAQYQLKFSLVKENIKFVLTESTLIVLRVTWCFFTIKIVSDRKV